MPVGGLHTRAGETLGSRREKGVFVCMQTEKRGRSLQQPAKSLSHFTLGGPLSLKPKNVSNVALTMSNLIEK